ncbi:unnamed protein product [Chrysodeixis includens]|uniref:Uncharacterized protein n=1 Tax=Chrysodeixis includens TaxID=689277 RepID=A0A9N8KSU3_CHRIL|nr:unnamed protein product [Chrysodeixis includens]
MEHWDSPFILSKHSSDSNTISAKIIGISEHTKQGWTRNCIIMIIYSFHEFSLAEGAGLLVNVLKAGTIQIYSVRTSCSQNSQHMHTLNIDTLTDLYNYYSDGLMLTGYSRALTTIIKKVLIFKVHLH